MGTETRIGIATGLVIVVVASVYFFYGSDRSEDDLLMVSGTRLSEVPAVPPGTATRDPGHRPAVRQHSPSISAPKAAQGRRAAPPANKPWNHRVDAAARLASDPPPTAGDVTVAAAHHRPPTQLRSEPSSILIDATRKNLEQSPTRPEPNPARAGELERTSPKPAPAAGVGERKPPPEQGVRGPVRKRLVDAANARPAAERDRPTGPSATKTSAPIQPPLPKKPVAVWPRRHTVVSGDTLSGISSQYYGTSGAVDRILAANAHVKNPRSLRIGHVLVIPAPDPPAAAESGPAPEVAQRTATSEPSVPAAGADSVRTYRVQPGDSFYSIAQKMYGQPGRWRDIYAANRALVNDDSRRLRPGMMLRIPQ